MNPATTIAPPPPPPAKRGLISRAIFAGFLAGFFLTTAPPAEAQTDGTITIGVSESRGLTPMSSLRVNEGENFVIVLTAHGKTGGTLTVTNTVSGEATLADFHQAATLTPSRAIVVGSDSVDTPYRTLDDDIPEPDETITFTIADSGIDILLATTPPAWTVGDPASVTITIMDNDGYVDPTADDPAARAERLEVPVAAVARGVGQLAADAISRRIGGDTRLGLWAGGGYVSAEGDHEGVTYDGDTSALHLGVDTTWRDGLIGITIARSDGDIDFNNTDNLETTVTSVHPYLIRPFNGAQLWTTIGYGSGAAELKEPDTVIKTDIKVLTGAFGVTHVQGGLLTANIGALFSRAKLDSATGNDKTLPAVTVSTLRIAAGAEAGWSRGDWRPFLTVNLRHDAGDGDDGGAIDGGGGVEYQTATVNVRLEAAGRVQGNGVDENRLSLTAGKTAGRLNLGLTVTAANGIDTANLLSGEWRF